MGDILKLKAPKGLKLTKPRPRTKDVNQNDIQKKLKPEDFLPPTSYSHTLLQEENYEIRGNSFECLTSYSSDSSNVLIGDTQFENVHNNVNLALNCRDNNNGNCRAENGRDSETSSVCSNSDDINANNLKSTEIVYKMRAPRKVKLTKPRPLRSSKSDENGNENDMVNGNEEKKRDLTSTINLMTEQLRKGTLSVNDTLKLRDLLADNCPYLEQINKECVDSCFQQIENVVKQKNMDKLILKKTLTWNDLLREKHKVSMLNDTIVPQVKTQMSVDSGIGDIEDHVLWDTEEAFEADLPEEIMTEFNKAQCDEERSPSPNSIIEAVQGLKIVGEDVEIVKAAAELLKKFLKNGQIPEPNNSRKTLSKTCKDELKNNILRHPIGPGTSEELLKEVEKTLPGGMHTAKGRRAMFKTYNNAMSVSSNDVQELTVPSKPYSREELLYLSLSPLSQKCPPELSYLSKVFPDICFVKVDKYFHKDDLPIRDYSWNCPVVAQRCEKYLPEDNTGFSDNNRQSGFGTGTIRREFSCPSSDSCGDGLLENGYKRPGFGTPNLKRVFSCPSSTFHGSEEETPRRGTTVDESQYEDRLSTGLGTGFKRSTSFGSQGFTSHYNSQNCSQHTVEKKRFGSPGIKGNSPSGNEEHLSPKEQQYFGRNGFGSPHKNCAERRLSLSMNDSSEELWDV